MICKLLAPIHRLQEILPPVLNQPKQGHFYVDQEFLECNCIKYEYFNLQLTKTFLCCLNYSQHSIVIKCSQRAVPMLSIITKFSLVTVVLHIPIFSVLINLFWRQLFRSPGYSNALFKNLSSIIYLEQELQSFGLCL